MKIKICYAILLVFIVTGAFCGCGTTTNGTKSSFEELDVHYITNSNFPHQKWDLHIEKSIL